VARLRNRQITMEEATELFGIMQEMVVRAGARVPSLTGAGPSSPKPAAAPGAPPAGGLALADDTLALSMIAAGAGAGMLAAILKRAAEGPKSPPPA
jgi:hypothetical protein